MVRATAIPSIKDETNPMTEWEKPPEYFIDFFALAQCREVWMLSVYSSFTIQASRMGPTDAPLYSFYPAKKHTLSFHYVPDVRPFPTEYSWNWSLHAGNNQPASINECNACYKNRHWQAPESNKVISKYSINSPMVRLWSGRDRIIVAFCVLIVISSMRALTRRRKRARDKDQSREGISA